MLEAEWDASADDTRDNASVQEQARVVRRFAELRVAAREGTDTSAMLARARHDWHRWFLPLQMETRCGAFGVAWGDLGFVAMCHVWARRGDPLDLAFTDIWHTWVRLVVVSSQHTAASRAHWPTADEWEETRTRVALVVARYFDGAPPSRAALVHQLTQGTAEEERKQDGLERDARAGAAHVMGALPDALAAAHEERRMPPSLALFKRKEREKAAAEVAANTLKASDVREEASIEAQGALWRATTVDLVHEYVRIATRVVHKVDTDNALVAHYERVPPRRFNQVAYARAYAWVVTRCKTEQTDAMTKLFRDTANTWWQPLGADTHRWRNKLTRSDLCGAQSMLRDEIGIDLMQHMHERSMVQMPKLAAAHPGASPSEDACLLWTPLFLVLVHYALLQQSSKKIDFIGAYVHAQSHERAVRARLDQTHFRGMPRRPLLVLAQRRWWLQHAGRLHGPHDSLLHAALEWFYVLAREFGGQTEDGYDVGGVGALFLGDMHTCLRGEQHLLPQ